MSASVTITEANGVTPTWTQEADIYFCTADVQAPLLDYPLSIPSTGYRHSYWKTLCLEIAGTFSKVSNIKFFSDGNVGFHLGTGGGMFVGTKAEGDSGLAIASYDQATGEEGVSGDPMDDPVDGHATYKGAGYTVVDVETYTSMAALLIDSTEYTEAGKTKATVLQVKCDTAANGAVQGAQSPEPLYWKYDEI